MVAADIEQFLELVRQRRSVRSYKADIVPEQAIGWVLEAGRWAPSGYNLQPWDFIVIQEAERRASVVRIIEQEMARWRSTIPGFTGQIPAYLRMVPVLIAIVGDKTFREKLPGNRRGASADKIYYSSIAAAIQNMQLAAAAQRLGTVQFTVGSEDDTQDEFRALLGLPPEKEVLFILPLGCPAENPPPDRAGKRRPLREVWHDELYRGD